MGKVKTRRVIIVGLIVMWLIFHALSYSDEEDLGEGYVYDRDGYLISGRIGIPQFVEDVKYNQRFIIVRQNPRGVRVDTSYYKIKFEYTEGLDTTYYWIIDKPLQEYYGPLMYDQFLKKRADLNIELNF